MLSSSDNPWIGEMNLIALDMDGVVNSSTLVQKWVADKHAELAESIPDEQQRRIEVNTQFLKEFRNMRECVFPELAARITKICEVADADILWTSSWRNLPEYAFVEKARDMFNRRGLPGERLIGYTPDLGADCTRTVYRGTEIRYWISNNVIGTINKCAVIDDRFDAGKDLPDCCKFFHTLYTDGITEDIMSDIIEYFKA